MAGHGKGARGGKRGSSSSSSSYISTTMMLLLVGFCLYGVYMISSSSITPYANSTAHHQRNTVSFPRSILRDPPLTEATDAAALALANEDTQAILPEDDDHDPDHLPTQLQNQEKVTSTSAGTEEDSQSEVEGFQHEKRQQEEEVETHPEEVLKLQDAAAVAQSDSASHSDSEVQQQEQSQSETSDAEGRQAEEIIGQGGQNQQIIQQVTSQSHSEEMGITSLSQIEHDNDGTTEEHEHQNQEEQQPQEQEEQPQEKLEEHQQQQQEEQEEEQKQKEEEQQQQQQVDEEQQQQKQEEQQQQPQMDEDQQLQKQEEQHQQQQVDEEQQQQQQQVQQEEEQQEQQHKQLEEQQQQLQQEEEQHEQRQQQDEEQHEQRQQEEEQQNQQQQEEEQQQNQQQEEEQQQQNQQVSQQQKTEEESTTREKYENNQQNEENPNVSESLPAVSTEKETTKKTWATQADQSSNEKEKMKENESFQSNEVIGGEDDGDKVSRHEWELCNVATGQDYIPCLDNEKVIKSLRGLGHFEHRERHCPEESPTCLVPLPEGYKQPIKWPESRDRIWYSNVPHTKLVEVKGHQNWVKVAGDYLTFPGGGTQFIHGALHYIDYIQESVPEIEWGKHTRVILDVGCGVASFGGYLFDRDVLAMSFAPKDEHEAQVQFALERGIPAISAVMGSQRLPFPSRVFDIVHCARCRVPWHANGGTLLLELNRVLRPGGYFVWSATPVYQKKQEDVEIWEAMSDLTRAMCWELVTITKDEVNSAGAAMYRKPVTNDCYEQRSDPNPPMCNEDDDPNAAWYVPLQTCMHRVPVDPSERGAQWPKEWPQRLQAAPYWLNSSQIGVYGRPAPEDFVKDYDHWKLIVKKSYLAGFGIDWSRVRNAMDMRAVYGGFAAALRDMKVWVMNVVNIDSPDTLPIIYERGLFGMYHDWCESFSTYPRTYDLLHADRLFSQLKKRCRILPAVAEVDRIVRPGGKVIVRDESAVVSEVENLLKTLHWEIRLSYSKSQYGILCAEKSYWRPEKYSAAS